MLLKYTKNIWVLILILNLIITLVFKYIIIICVLVTIIWDTLQTCNSKISVFYISQNPISGI